MINTLNYQSTVLLKIVWETSLSPDCGVSYLIFTKSPRFGKYTT